MVFIYFCSNSNIVKDLASPTVICVKEEGVCSLAMSGFWGGFCFVKRPWHKTDNRWNEGNGDRVSWNHYLQILDEWCCKIWGSKQWCWWRAKSCRILCHFASWIATDVSEECAASIFRVQQSVKAWPARHVHNSRRLRSPTLFGWSVVQLARLYIFSMITLLLI